MGGTISPMVGLQTSPNSSSFLSQESLGPCSAAHRLNQPRQTGTHVQEDGARQACWARTD